MDIYVAGGIDLNRSVSVKVTFFYASFFPWTTKSMDPFFDNYFYLLFSIHISIALTAKFSPRIAY